MLRQCATVFDYALFDLSQETTEAHSTLPTRCKSAGNVMVVEICEYLKIDIFIYIYLPCQNLTHIEENSND